MQTTKTGFLEWMTLVIANLWYYQRVLSKNFIVLQSSGTHMIRNVFGCAKHCVKIYRQTYQYL